MADPAAVAARERPRSVIPARQGRFWRARRSDRSAWCSATSATSPLYAMREALAHSQRGGGRRTGRAGRGLADHLGADPDRHDQVRRLPDARPTTRAKAALCALMALAQPLAADGAPGRGVLPRRWSARRCSTATASSPRPSRCWRAVEGLEGRAGRRPRARAPFILPIVGRVLIAAVPGAVPRHRRRMRQVLRTDHAALVVPGPGRRWACYHIARRPLDPAGPVAALRRDVPDRHTAARASSSWAACSWRSPGPRRSTPTWATSEEADPGRLADPGACRRWSLNYLGPGRAACWRHPARAAQSVLPDDPRAGLLAGAGAGHRRHRHRQPGGDHRRLLHDPAGGAAGPVPAHRHPPHQRDPGRPDLRAAGQHHAADRRAGAAVRSSSTSSNLAAAYGIAVTGAMFVDTLLFFFIVRHMWKRPVWQARWPPRPPSALLDLVFIASNLLKISARRPGCRWCWAAALVVIMWTWTRGAQILTDKTRRDGVPLVELSDILKARAPHRAPGTAIFLTSDPDIAPGRPDAQPQAQQGAAREEHHPHRRRPPRPRGSRRGPHAHRAGERRLQEGDHRLRLHGDAPTSPRRWACAASRA